MVDFAARHGYPRTVRTPRDLEITLRLLGAGDREAMLVFARNLPAHDLLFLRRDITQETEVDAWIASGAGGDLITVLALNGEEIGGYCVVDRSPLPWMRHVAELRVVVGANVRGQGLGRILTREGFRLAAELGVEKIIAQMTTDQATAITVFQNMGFENEAFLRNHVQDRDGKKYDLLVLSRGVSDFEASVIAEQA